LVTEFWGGQELPDENISRSYGSGKIYWGGTQTDELYPEYELTASVLKEMGVSEDFTSSDSIRYAHRQSKEHEIYFLSNKTTEKIKTACRFRVGKGQPELWDPLTGTSRPLPQFKQEKGITTIPMEFDAHQSFFVVFPFSENNKTKAYGESNFPEKELFTAIDGPWRVSFDTEWGGPGTVSFDELQDWSKSEEDGIKYYSGIAKYSKRFEGIAQSGYTQLFESRQSA